VVVVAAAAAAVPAGASPTAPATERRGREAGLRAGFAVNGRVADFRQAEAFYTRRLPWTWMSPADRWTLQTRLTGSAGILTADGDTGAVITLGPQFLLQRDGWPLGLIFGCSPTLVSEDVYDGAEIGGHFHFTSHVGLRLRRGNAWRLGYRLQHMSNASTSEPNPGVDIHMLIFGRSF
jgi:hypothetical protein